MFASLISHSLNPISPLSPIVPLAQSATFYFVARQLNFSQKSALAVAAGAFVLTYPFSTLVSYLNGSPNLATTLMLAEMILKKHHEKASILDYNEVALTVKCCTKGVELCCDVAKRMLQCSLLVDDMPNLFPYTNVQACVLHNLGEFIPTGMASAWANLNACFTSGNFECYVLNNRIFECFANNQFIEPVASAVEGSLECLANVR